VKFKSFYINHEPHQQNTNADALASHTASLAFPTRAREKVLVHKRDLYWPKFTLEDSQTPEGEFQVNEVFETSAGPELRDNLYSSTMSYTTYFPVILRRQLP